MRTKKKVKNAIVNDEDLHIVFSPDVDAYGNAYQSRCRELSGIVALIVMPKKRQQLSNSSRKVNTIPGV
jgi:hypothetical protein